MSWYQTVGKAVAGTASIAGVITAAPVFGAIGTITAGDLWYPPLSAPPRRSLIKPLMRKNRPQAQPCILSIIRSSRMRITMKSKA